MTLEGKAKAYDEALEKAKFYHGNCPSEPERKKLEKMFPVLHESEEERIRKALVWHLKAGEDFVSNGVTKAECIAYLEKQKEHEQDEGDFTIYHPQKNGEGNYECIPFSFYGSLTSFSNDKDLMDFLNECFYDKEECERWCEVENKPELPECKHKVKKDSVFDYLCESSGGEKQKEQKPWSKEDEEIIYSLRSFLIQAEQSGRYGSIQIAQIEQCLNWLKALRPQSKDEIYKEKDKAFKLGKHQLAIEFMNYLDENRPEGKMSLSNGECEDIDKAFKENDWAKIIRYVEKYRPSWKPSEHQMNILKAVKEYVGRGSGYWGEGLGSLIEDLEKLM